MIFVTLGTQDKPFNRLLEAVQKQIDNKKIKGKVIVQAGCTKFNSKKMKIFDLISIDELDKLTNEADIKITHGGVGSIISGIKKNKKVIVCPRLKKYKEHINDHQIEVCSKLQEEGYILYFLDGENFNEKINTLKSTTFKEYKNNNKFLEILRKEI